MTALLDKDVHHILGRIPKDVVQLLRDDPRIFMAGGICRAIIAQEKPSDIDMFGPDAETLLRTAEKLVNYRIDHGEPSKIHKTENALTVFTPNRLPIQFITRWTFTAPVDLLKSFDFTVCQALIHFDPVDKIFRSAASDLFYPDLAARRLNYTSPKRNEDAGGSILRVIKYVKRGYSVQVDSLGAVCARLYGGLRAESEAIYDEKERALVLTGLLRQVDPLLRIDGVELADEDHHRPERMA